MWSPYTRFFLLLQAPTKDKTCHRSRNHNTCLATFSILSSPPTPWPEVKISQNECRPTCFWVCLSTVTTSLTSTVSYRSIQYHHHAICLPPFNMRPSGIMLIWTPRVILTIGFKEPFKRLLWRTMQHVLRHIARLRRHNR
jgi:hypothetical protein